MKSQLGCAAHGFKYREGCDACTATEPQTDSAVPPERIWPKALQIAVQAGSWFERKDMTLQEREQHVAGIISDFVEFTTRSVAPAEQRELAERIAEQLRTAVRNLPYPREYLRRQEMIDIVLTELNRATKETDDGK